MKRIVISARVHKQIASLLAEGVSWRAMPELINMKLSANEIKKRHTAWKYIINYDFQKPKKTALLAPNDMATIESALRKLVGRASCKELRGQRIYLLDGHIVPIQEIMRAAKRTRQDVG